MQAGKPECVPQVELEPSRATGFTGVSARGSIKSNSANSYLAVI